MKLGVFNCSKDILEELPYDVVQLDNLTSELDVDALFIDWLPRNLTDSKKLAQQAALVEACAKGKKTVVLFDKYLDINEREYKYLKKFNTLFFEPAVNYREGFSFLPPWTKCYDLTELPTYGERGKRDIDLGYIGTLKNRMKGFEKYYVEFAELYPKFNVSYSSSLPKPKIDEYKDAGVTKKEFAYKDMKCFILIDTPRNYEIGYLNPDVFDIISMGCFPMLPIEHRFYHSVFEVIKDIKFIPFNIQGWEKVREVMLLDMYNNIKTVFPEMSIEYAVETIKKCVEK